jgi:hypothetical protein
MINLAEHYGDKIFNRKLAYRKAEITGYISAGLVDIVIVIGIIKVFNINWEYAFIKVYGLKIIYDILKPVFTWPIYKFNEKYVLRKLFKQEINHYLQTYKVPLHEDNTGTYSDFFLYASFNEYLSIDDRVLAAINYGVIVGAASTTPRIGSIIDNAWDEAVPEIIKTNPERYINREEYI